MKRLLIAVLFILSTVIPVIAQTENASDDTVAATVNGEIIYMDTFLSKVQKDLRWQPPLSQPL